MRVLVAPQEYKGTLTAVKAAQAIAAAIATACPDAEVDSLPMADGGPGTAAALIGAARGEWRTARAHDPLMRDIDASWGLLPTGVAVVECAAASGLLLLRPGELDPRRASSFGTGDLIAAALAAGTREIIVGLGGSATNDGGAGMAQALGYRLLDDHGVDLPPGGSPLARLARIERPHETRETAVKFLAATDVENVLTGPEGASAVYGPQKGADQAAIEDLDAALHHFADIIERDLAVAVRGLKGGGAAGGLGAGCVAFLGAELGSGAKIVGDAAGLDARVAAADLVFTGEGRLDGQTVFGKSTAYVARVARERGKTVVCLPGSLGLGWQEAAPLFNLVLPLGTGPDAAQSLHVAAMKALATGLLGC
jgi:glycerate 2-kinase